MSEIETYGIDVPCKENTDQDEDNKYAHLGKCKNILNRFAGCNAFGIYPCQNKNGQDSWNMNGRYFYRSGLKNNS